MAFQLDGIGTAVPRELVTQEDAARLALELCGSAYSQAATIPVLYRRAGVRKRHSVVLTSSTNGQPAQQSFFSVAADRHDRGPSTAQRMRRYETDALELACQAVNEALDAAGCQPHDISDLVTVSCSGFSAPGVGVGLIRRIGLPPDVSRTTVGFMGCHGALNGLRVAHALSRTDSARRVLLCCVELCTLHQQYTQDAQRIVANALFSDGAAAVVGRRARDDGARWRLVAQRSYVVPDTISLMRWRIGDHGFEMTLSPRVPDLIRHELRPWLTHWLADHSLDVRDVRGWAIHPGGPRVLTACAESLGLSDIDIRPSQQVLADFGNMSSPTVLFILEQFRRQPDRLPCVVLAFGPGLTIEAALIR
jgi:predicted naringenin-chalcone synthase